MARNRTFLVLLSGLCGVLALPGCMLPETASRLQIGSATATLPKNDQFESVEYEESRPDGTLVKFKIKGGKANPESALVAYTQAQSNATSLLKDLVAKIPTTPLPVPPLPIK